MKWDDNEHCSEPKIQMKYLTKSKHGPVQQLELELAAMKELTFSADKSNPPCDLCRKRENRKYQ